MKVVKALNNNMVLARDDQGNDCICQGKGIGFQKRSGDPLDSRIIERCFRPSSLDESRHFQQLFSEIPDEYWEIAEKLIAYGKDHFGIQVSQRIILPLCDHMAGSVERYRRHVELKNPLLWDIKRIYPKEFKIGKYALTLLKESFGISMEEDEAAFLAYHFASAQLNNSPGNASQNMMTTLVVRIIDLVLIDYHFDISNEERLYLMIHIERVTRRYRNK